MLERQARAWPDLGLVARGQRRRETGGNQDPAAGGEFDVVGDGGGMPALWSVA